MKANKNIKKEVINLKEKLIVYNKNKTTNYFTGYFFLDASKRTKTYKPYYTHKESVTKIYIEKSSYQITKIIITNDYNAIDVTLSNYIVNVFGENFAKSMTKIKFLVRMMKLIFFQDKL